MNRHYIELWIDYYGVKIPKEILEQKIYELLEDLDKESKQISEIQLDIKEITDVINIGDY